MTRRPLPRCHHGMAPGFCVVAGCQHEERQLARQRSEIEDCGQDGVCRLSPGCNRHWEERNRELVRERDAALARVAELEEALREIAAIDSASPEHGIAMRALGDSPAVSTPRLRRGAAGARCNRCGHYETSYDRAESLYAHCPSCSRHTRWERVEDAEESTP